MEKEYIRAIDTHHVNTCNRRIVILALEEAGAGGANCLYDIRYDNANGLRVLLPFHQGVIGEGGLTGVTNEALLAILIDRFQGFQRGPFACRENALALTKLEEAMHWINTRTKQREARGVEGTHEV